MITYQNNIFHIQGDGFSSLMRINKYGQLEQLHFGEEVEMGDVQALEYHTGLGWGSSILLDDSDLASCPDVIPYVWSENGRVYGVNLIYSGNHYASVQKSYQGLTRIMQGISPNNFNKKLATKESFETPESVICFSDKGYGGMSEKMHGFVNKHIIPEYWQERERPVLYNSWEGCMFDFDQRRLLNLAKTAKDLGCEMFVLDDGWFGKRNDDKAGLGDYNINKKKLPQGMNGFADKIHALGLEFGLWFEPESVNMDSDLYRAHPDWALTDEFNPVLGRHQLLLDLTKEEVRDYIVENVGKVLDNANINYVKFWMFRI